jgi:transposase
MQITTVGLDLAKRVFQVHGIDAAGEVVVRKALRRAQVLPFFAKLPPLPRWHRGVRHVPSLGMRVDPSRA